MSPIEILPFASPGRFVEPGIHTEIAMRDRGYDDAAREAAYRHNEERAAEFGRRTKLRITMREP